MSGRQKRSESHGRLLDLWERKEEFGRAVGCVATTYTFDAGFFEEECLTRFAGIDSDPAEALAVYLVEREEKLADVFACVLVDQGHVAPQRSLRWGLLSVRVPGGGVQHAKLALLVWEHRVRILLGSCNLTQPGYRRNLENLSALDFTSEGETPLGTLNQVLSFLEDLCRMAPGQGAGVGPQVAMTEFLAVVRKQVASWEQVEWPRQEPSAVFLSVFPGRAHLFAQIDKEVWTGTGPSTAWVLSPFFDQVDNCRPTVEALEAILARNGERTVWFMGSGTPWPDGRVDLAIPASLKAPWLRRMMHRFALVQPRDDQGNSRALHAKSLWLERDEQVAYVVGSSNFTAAGTGVAGARSNVEANVAYRIPNGRAAFGRRCEESYPPYEELDANRTIGFDQQITEETPDPEAYVALPEAFGSALYRPEGNGGVLYLELLSELPVEFNVRSQEGAVLGDAHAWRGRGVPREESVPWAALRPPSALQVEWLPPDGGLPRRSWWIVNVTDASRLPPPEELRDLPLALLLEILSSARPLHEVVAAALRHGSRADGAPAELDPHRKVDTSQYLLKRVKRVSVALEGLRQRLGRPAFSLEALRWRLDGPVGPLALARQVVAEEPRAAAFLLAEIVLLLTRLDLRVTTALLGVDVVTSEIERVAAILREMATAQPAPSAVASYVAETLSGVGR